MKFSNDFQKYLEKQFQINSKKFITNCFEFTEQNFTNISNVLFSNMASLSFPFLIEKNEVINNISKTLNIAKNPIVQLRKGNWGVFRENEIKFDFFKDSKLEYNSKIEIDYRVFRENIEYNSENSFWENSKNKSDYYELSNFKCFADFESDDLIKLQNKVFLYNIIDWQLYIRNLIKINFPDFKVEKFSTKSTLRYLKVIDNDIMLGFEYEESKMISELKKGKVNLTDYFNLIVVNNTFNSKENSKDYIYKLNENIISLGILGNPFFYPPCFPLSSFSVVELYHYGDYYPNNIQPKQIKNIQKIGEKYILTHCEDYGEKLKKHAYFYMKLLSLSSESYLAYVETSILDTIKN